MKSKIFLFFTIYSICITAFAQNVYKTPSGSKYHTATCRSIKNFSNVISKNSAISLGLTACSICKPDLNSASNTISESLGFTSSVNNNGIQNDELLGVKNNATQCTSKTKAGSRCKNKTKNANGRCHKHDK